MTGRERPVLGMVLKGYPRISETFISNEILLLGAARIYKFTFSRCRRRGRILPIKASGKCRPGPTTLPRALLISLTHFLCHHLFLVK